MQQPPRCLPETLKKQPPRTVSSVREPAASDLAEDGSCQCPETLASHNLLELLDEVDSKQDQEAGLVQEALCKGPTGDLPKSTSP